MMYGFYEHARDNYKYPSCWSVKNNSCLPHFHSSIELVYLVDGEQKSNINSGVYTVLKDQLSISSSYMVHSYSTESYSDSIILIVPLDFIPSYRSILSKKAFSQCVYDTKDDEGELLHCMERILSEMESDQKSSLTIIKGYIYVILGMLIERVGLADMNEDESSSLTKDILIYLQDNYLEKLSLEMLAQKFGYSKSRFSHIFNKRFGCGISEYIDTMRCRHAAVMLSNSSTLIDAALNSGFESMRTFYRCFKRCFGVTPSDYRDSLNDIKKKING